MGDETSKESTEHAESGVRNADIHVISENITERDDLENVEECGKIILKLFL
jgi:hypothetical protein